jgi:hypothetical protein
MGGKMLPGKVVVDFKTDSRPLGFSKVAKATGKPKVYAEILPVITVVGAGRRMGTVDHRF